MNKSSVKPLCHLNNFNWRAVKLFRLEYAEDDLIFPPLRIEKDDYTLSRLINEITGIIVQGYALDYGASMEPVGKTNYKMIVKHEDLRMNFGVGLELFHTGETKLDERVYYLRVSVISAIGTNCIK